MMDPGATDEQIGEAGVRLWKKEDSLNTLRYAKFMEMIVSTKKLDPYKLQEQHTITAYVSTYKLFFGRSLLSIPSTQHCGGGS